MAYDQRPLYVRSVAAELADLSPQMLRGYERKGLIEPARSLGGSRPYSEADLARLRRISQLTGAGLNLAGVHAVPDLEDHLASLQADLDDERERSHVDTPSWNLAADPIWTPSAGSRQSASLASTDARAPLRRHSQDTAANSFGSGDDRQ